MKWILLLLTSSILAAEPCCFPEGQLFTSTPCLDDSCPTVIWYADGSLLAWQAREEGLSFALKNDPLPIPATTNIHGELVDIDFNWEPAYKLNFGADFPSRAWDVDFRWTYFHTLSKGASHHPASANSAGLIPIWVLPSANIAAQFLYGAAHGSWELNLNEFDIEMGFHPFLSPSLAFRFQAGLKVIKADQDFHVTYSDGFNDGVNQLVSAKTHLNTDAIGTGPRIGFDSQWFLGKGFSLLASIAGSLPLWQFQVIRSDFDSGFVAGTSATVDSFFRQRFWTFRPVVETALGLGWDHCFGCRCQYALGLHANYEFQYFAEQNATAILVNPGVLHQAYELRGDLHLHGATLTFHFGY